MSVSVSVKRDLVAVDGLEAARVVVRGRGRGLALDQLVVREAPGLALADSIRGTGPAHAGVLVDPAVPLAFFDVHFCTNQLALEALLVAVEDVAPVRVLKIRKKRIPVGNDVVGAAGVGDGEPKDPIVGPLLVLVAVPIELGLVVVLVLTLGDVEGVDELLAAGLGGLDPRAQDADDIGVLGELYALLTAVFAVVGG